MLNTVALRRLRCWINDSSGAPDLLQAKVLALELGQLGFRLENMAIFTATTRADFTAAIATLTELRGGNVQYVPLFSNFPDDLPNDYEYLFRRVLGFWGLDSFADEGRFGANPISQMQQEDLWQKAIAAQSKKLSDTQTEWIDLTIVSPAEGKQRLQQWAIDLLYGTTPIKEALWEDIFTVLGELAPPIDLDKVLIKETLARLAAEQWQKWGKVIVKTPTDLLRMWAFMQGQDVSLAQPVDLKGLKFSKPQRRSIITFLNGCHQIREDLLRYRQLWISLSRWLHPGDFSRQFPRVAVAFDDLRNNRIKSFESRAINAPVEDRVETLLERPSVLLRKLTWLLKDGDPVQIAVGLLSLKDRVESLPLPLLMNAYCALNYHGERAVINKQGKPYTIDKRSPANDPKVVLAALDKLILVKLSNTKDWQTVWIDPDVYSLVLPLQSRKQSDGLLNLARGSRIPVTADVIRLFVYWQEMAEQTDLDLSVMKLNRDFQYVDHIAWNNYGDGNDVAHSGDIQSAPLGAAEFIDIRLAAMADSYVLPAVLRYAGEGFSGMKACYAGWMNRQNIGSDMETFDAKTVAEKVTVNQEGRTWIPFLLDVNAKAIICVDLYFRGRNTIEGNAHFPALAKAIADYWQSKPTFGALADWYVRANHAKLVDRADAEVSIGCDDNCTINVLKLVGQRVTSF